MDKKSTSRRERNTGKTDDELAMEYIEVVKSKFNSAKGKNITNMFLDACYDEEDADEKLMFEKSMEELHALLTSLKGLPTCSVNDKVSHSCYLQGYFTTIAIYSRLRLRMPR